MKAMNKNYIPILAITVLATLMIIGYAIAIRICPDAIGESNTDTTVADTAPNSENSPPVTEETTSPDTTALPDTTEEPAVPDELTKIEALMSSMTTQELVGQLFFADPYTAGFDGLNNQYHVGGLVLFANHFANLTKDQIIANISAYQGNSKIPLLIGVDEEGGSVVRVSLNPALRKSPFLSPRDVFSTGGWDAIDSDAREKADLLLSLGVNVNLGPVCDLSQNPYDFIYYRAFSGDAESTCTFIEKTVKASTNKNLGTVLKHFPGYGNNVDTHTGIAYDHRPYSEFLEKDLLPFIRGIESGADSIMVSHNIVYCMDPTSPASLSESIHSLIRNDLSFEGVIMTDDLSMSAITLYTNGENAAVRAVKCGNDMLCTTNIANDYPAVLAAVNSGEITIDRIKESVFRILLWKHRLGLLESIE
ncbi:MAG: beta-hexosaminidase [Clostridia bacterium]|nr:beta-hexosaminidase [Clostridia bacterium]